MAIARESFPLSSLQAPPPEAIPETSVATLAELFSARVQLTPQAPACRWFDAARHGWSHLSWEGLDARVQAFTRGLAALGLPAGARVAIQLDNGPDWVAAEQAIHRLGLVAVGLYIQDTPGNAAYILGHSGASAAFLRDAQAWQQLREAAGLPELRQVILQRGGTEGAERALALDAFLAAGTEPPPHRGVRTALASLVYTSGTTGKPRGAMLSHGALLANVFACRRALQVRDDDCLLSLLPLSHSFERIAGWHGAVLAGAETAFSRGPDWLADDLREVHPTGLLAVPRVFERLYARLLRGVDDGPLHRRALFHLALQAGVPGDGARQRFSRRLTGSVVEAVRAGLGGRLRLAISGGAPLSAQIARSFAALGLPVLQGYGLTEAGPVVSVNRPGDADPESAGRALDNVETRIGPDGELLVRSPSLMSGYWQDEAATRAVLDEAGWLHTGDKVSRLCSDRLYLTGRLKDLLVMSTGVKAAPCEIESRLTAEPLFEQVVVLGEARPYLVALVVPDAALLSALRQELHLPAGAVAEDEAARAALEKALLVRCRERLAELPASHQIKRIACVLPFTLANGLLTSTHKPRRAAITRQYAAELDRLYAGHCSSHATDCSRNAEAR